MNIQKASICLWKKNTNEKKKAPEKKIVTEIEYFC
jgi:hypothetical protein